MRTYQAMVTTFTVLGILPFAYATYLSLNNESLLGSSGATLFAAYGAIIISFLSGVLCGRIIELPENRNGITMLIFSFVCVTGAWVSLLFKTPQLSVVLLLLSLITIFWVEARWLKKANKEKPYHPSLSFGFTSVLSIMHLLVLYPHY